MNLVMKFLKPELIKIRKFPEDIQVNIYNTIKTTLDEYFKSDAVIMIREPEDNQNKNYIIRIDVTGDPKKIGARHQYQEAAVLGFDREEEVKLVTAKEEKNSPAQFRHFSFKYDEQSFLIDAYNKWQNKPGTIGANSIFQAKIRVLAGLTARKIIDAIIENSGKMESLPHTAALAA